MFGEGAKELGQAIEVATQIQGFLAGGDTEFRHHGLGEVAALGNGRCHIPLSQSQAYQFLAGHFTARINCQGA